MSKVLPLSNYIPNSVIYNLNHQQISQGEVPSILYKYWSINSVLRFLESGMILFNRYNDFNDPFECQAIIDTSNSVSEWKTFLLKNGLDACSSHEKSKLLSSNNKMAANVINKSIKAIYNNTGIFCMTTKNDNLLMWAHYGDSHKGVCVEFDITKDLNVFCPIKRVEYNSNYRKYNYLRDSSEATHSLAYKSKDWEYEDEYRIIHPEGYGLMSVNKDAVKTIIFGCRAGEADIKAVKNALSNNGYLDTKIKIANLSKTSYKLDII